MRRALACAHLALLFLASILPSHAQKAGGERVVSVRAGAPLAVECELRVEQRVEWRRDGAAPPADMRASERPAAGGGGGGGVSARLQAAAARAEHAGLYTCAAGAPPVRVVLRDADDARPHDTEAAPTAAAAAAAAEELGSPAGGGLLYYVVRGPLALDCRGLAPAGADPATIVWTKNDTNVEDIPGLKEHLRLSKDRDQLSINGRSHEDDFGNYTCSVGGATRAWEVRGKPHASLPANTNVVEEQKLKLTCKITGKPYPEVRWLYSNVTANVTEMKEEATEALGERVKLATSEQGIAGAQLVLEPAKRSDAGWFACVPAGGVGSPAVTTLRVKDMYAALWPFLGICAEVFVLCAIILVYEKRRTKPELDDSDTDNHDQKKS